MSLQDDQYSLVEYMSDNSGYKCGYCKSKSTNFSHGMWAHKMTVGDYQDLIDRGWRRSGKYCYKPTMHKTCCPMYTIKCDALELKLTKAQKKVLKRMHRYLSHGDVKNDQEGRKGNGSSSSNFEESRDHFRPEFAFNQDLPPVAISSLAIQKSKELLFGNQHEPDNYSSKKTSQAVGTIRGQSSSESADVATANNKRKDLTPKGSQNVNGPDPNKAPAKKSKVIRRERREAKLAKKREEALSRGETLMEETKTTHKNNTPKTLEDFLNEPLPENLAHKLELKLVRVSNFETSFRGSYDKSYEVYRTYQMKVHHDQESECDKSCYQSFLVDGPLVPWHPEPGPPDGYGSFHQQYWLDGRLIAVGVLDVLPNCISSVYLYYDPEFSFLSLGTYASLRELALTRELNRSASALKWYYMGFYIHSCPKMRYKGNYNPSLLLCPETYAWVPLEKATAKLEIAKYSRLCDDPSFTDEDGTADLNKIKILYDHELILYQTYRRLNNEDEEEVKEFATLAGAKAAYSMILYRS